MFSHLMVYPANALPKSESSDLTKLKKEFEEVKATIQRYRTQFSASSLNITVEGPMWCSLVIDGHKLEIEGLHTYLEDCGISNTIVSDNPPFHRSLDATSNGTNP